MGKKLNILLLALVFFTSTTALPYTIHACRMMEKSGGKACSMCEIKGKAKHAIPSGTQNIKNNGVTCCSSKLVDSAVKENFLQSSGSAKDLTQLKYIAPAIILSDVLTTTSTGTVEDNIHAPPLINDNPVYLLNSVFLI